MIHIENLSVGFDDTAIIKGFDASIEKGKHVVFTGGSGVGKTTLLNVLLGFLPCQEGRVIINNMPVNKENIDAIREETAYIPQEIQPPYNLMRDVFFEPFTFKRNRKFRPDEKEVERIMNNLALPEKILDKEINEISGGQKQRILLASAFLLKKPVILLDEPTTGLDENNIERVAEWLNAQQNITILSTSHHRKWIAHADKSYNLEDYGTNT
jgi:ABC-type multidrug transport system ATPase subunit